MIKAKISLGQNFLIDKNVANKIVNKIEIENKIILEVGAGYGFLTDFILRKKPKKLYIIEKDDNLCRYLLNKYKDTQKIQILNEDILNFDFNKFNNFNIISNLPYNISKSFVFKTFKHTKQIDQMILMLQKEVALKYNYKIKKLNKYKFLFFLCGNYEICFFVSKNVFNPKPKIESAIIKCKFNNKKIDWIKTSNFINKIFVNKRKKISSKIKYNTKENLNEILNKRIDEVNINELLKIYNIF